VCFQWNIPDARNKLALRRDKIFLGDHHGNIIRSGKMVEEVRCADRTAWELLNLFIYCCSFACDCLEHGIGAKGIEIGTSICKR
jgi:hypothetical protein